MPYPSLPEMIWLVRDRSPGICIFTGSSEQPELQTPAVDDGEQSGGLSGQVQGPLSAPRTCPHASD